MKAVEINRTIHTRLSALMASRAVSQEDMAAAIEADSRRMKRILSGVTVPTAAELVMAASRLGVTSSVITGETMYPAEAQA